MSKLRAGAWIRTAEGWREISASAPQVVFERDLYGHPGPIDWTTWVYEADEGEGADE